MSVDIERTEEIFSFLSLSNYIIIDYSNDFIID
jgi:hypothetical protein